MEINNVDLLKIYKIISLKANNNQKIVTLYSSDFLYKKRTIGPKCILQMYLVSILKYKHSLNSL